MTIGQRIVYLRERQNLSQAELASSLSIQRVSLNYYENDVRLPKTETIIAMAKFFDVSSDYLLGIQDVANTEYAATFNDFGLNEKSMEILRAYRNEDNPQLAQTINLLLEEVYNYGTIDGHYSLGDNVLSAIHRYYCVDLSPQNDEEIDIRKSGIFGSTNDFIQKKFDNADLNNYITVKSISRNRITEMLLAEEVTDSLRTLRKEIEKQGR